MRVQYKEEVLEVHGLWSEQAESLESQGIIVRVPHTTPPDRRTGIQEFEALLVAPPEPPPAPPTPPEPEPEPEPVPEPEKTTTRRRRTTPKENA